MAVPALSFIDDILAISDCNEAAIEVNAMIQNKISSKQLRFGTKKCFQIHVGGNEDQCSSLRVQGETMNRTKKEKYLGDILSNDSKINDNIDERKAKGEAAANQILCILQEISFGHSFFEMAMLLRTSIMISSMLSSSEALHGVKKAHIDKLENSDNYLMKRIFDVGTGSPICSYFLETGATPVHFLLLGRRLMFL